MAGNYGTSVTLDTLASIRNTTVFQYGEENIYQAVQNELDLVNAQFNAAVADFAEPTPDNMRAGDAANTDLEMVEVDQYGTPDAQKPSQATQNVGFPLRRFEVVLQWSKIAFERMRPFEIANATRSAIRGDRKRIFRDLKRALFSPTDYTFTDLWGSNANLAIPVKALANADGWVLPYGPNGEVFNGASHTHYLGTASFVAADITALWKTVAEHYSGGEMFIYINQAQEAAVRAMTSNFTPFTDARLINPNNVVEANGRLAPFNFYNRAIGIFDQTTVWVKPWVPAGYMYAFNAGARRVLALRQPDIGNTGTDLRLVYEDETHPLRAQAFQRMFGFGVQERTAGAVLYTGGTPYVAPTIT